MSFTGFKKARNPRAVTVSARQAPCLLDGVRLHQVPWMSAGGEQVHRGLVACRIVEARCVKPDDVGRHIKSDRHRIAAGRTEAALNRLAAAADHPIPAGLALERHRCLRKNCEGSIGAAGCSLAIAAMAVEHHGGFAFALITDGAASAPARPISHRSLPRLTCPYRRLRPTCWCRCSRARCWPWPRPVTTG